MTRIDATRRLLIGENPLQALDLLFVELDLLLLGRHDVVEPLLLDVEALLHLGDLVASSGDIVGRRQLSHGQRILHCGLPDRGVVRGLHAGDRALLRQNLLMQVRLEAGEVPDRQVERLFVLQRLDLLVGAAHHDEHRRWSSRARPA